jgi:hypothetical protein
MEPPGNQTTHVVEEMDSKHAGKLAVPPCLVNLLLDPDHPHHLEITADMRAHPAGCPGSFLDLLRTHVCETCGADAFLRALGSVPPWAMVHLMEQALVVQNVDTKAAAELADAAAGAALSLLQDRIADQVCASIQATKTVCTLLTDSPEIRAQLLVKVSAIPDAEVRIEVLRGLGLAAGEAARVVKLAAPWIPQEIAEPTAQSEADIEKADAILEKAAVRTVKALDALRPEIELWQISKQIDLIADLGPELAKARFELAIHKGSALDLAIGEHLVEVQTERSLSRALEIGIGLVCGPAGIAANLAASLPSILADKHRLDDVLLLEAMGHAASDAVSEAALSLAATIVGAATSAL